MLSFIADLPEADLQAVRRSRSSLPFPERVACPEPSRREGQRQTAVQGTISEANLYQILLDRWFANEEKRAVPKLGTKNLLETPDRWHAVTALALLLWQRTGEKRVSLEELDNTVRSVLSGLSYADNEAAAHEVGTGTLLERDEHQQFGFMHQSVMEFLVAKHAAADVLAEDNPLQHGKFSELMLKFLLGLGKQAAQHWAEHTQQDPQASAAALHNAKAVLEMLNVATISQQSYANGDWSNLELIDKDLAQVDFSKATLLDAKFVGSRLQGADFSGADLRNADFSRADVSQAKFIRADVRGARWEATQGLDYAYFSGAYGYPFRDPLRDGGLAPAMILLPAGRFKMGSTAYDSEQPMHEVDVPEFAIGRYPVTFAEYDAFCAATETTMPDDEKWGRGQRPVMNVSWDDAVAYCDWLSQQTGRRYRLPSEAEWEYACRAGSEGDYCFGSDEERLADYAWYRKNAEGKTHPVGEKQPNAWGLYDVHGNVWEWCQDTWHDSYKGAPSDGSAWETDGNLSRVLRGGSWYLNSNNCRAAERYYYRPVNRNSSYGFRVLRLAPRT